MSQNLYQRREWAPVILFTAAGASCAKGIDLPNMTQFFSRILMSEDHRARHELITQRDYFQFVMDTLYPLNSAPHVYDLERVLGALYKMSGAFDDDDTFGLLLENTLVARIVKNIHAGGFTVNHPSQNIDRSPDEVATLVKNTIAERFAEVRNASRQLLHELQMIIRLVYSEVSTEAIYELYGGLFLYLIPMIIESGRELSEDFVPIFPIFTTNYDPSIDYVFHPKADEACRQQHDEWRQNLGIDYTFSDGFMPDRYGTMFVWQENAFQPDAPDNGIFIPYHKLHGSVHWERYFEEIAKTTNVVSDLSDTPRSFQIIYPSDKRLPDSNPFAFSHRELERYLRHAHLLVVIGFAFRDPGIVYIFERALLDNPLLSIMIVGPEPNPWETVLIKFTEKPNVTHLVGRFGDPDVSLRLMGHVSEHLGIDVES